MQLRYRNTDERRDGKEHSASFTRKMERMPRWAKAVATLVAGAGAGGLLGSCMPPQRLPEPQDPASECACESQDATETVVRSRSSGPNRLDVRALEGAAFSDTGNFSQSVGGFYVRLNSAFVGMTPEEREAIVSELETRAQSAPSYDARLQALLRLGIIAAADGIDYSLRERIVETLYNLLYDESYFHTAIHHLVSIGTSEHVSLELKDGIVYELERFSQSGRGNALYVPDALHEIAIDPNSEMLLSAGIFEFLYENLPSSDGPYFSLYAHGLVGISLMDGMDGQHLERTIGVLGDRLGRGFAVGGHLCEIATAEAARPETVTRIVGLLEGAFNGDIALSLMEPFGEIASHAGTPQADQYRVVVIMESALNAGNAPMRTEAIIVLGAIDRAVNGEETTDQALRSRVLRSTIGATNDAESDVREVASRLLGDIASREGTTLQEITRIAGALESRLPHREGDDYRWTLDVVTEIAAGERAPMHLRARIVSSIEREFRNGNDFGRMDLAWSLGSIGESENAGASLRARIYQTLRGSADSPNPDVRSAVSRAMQRIEAAEQQVH